MKQDRLEASPVSSETNLPTRSKPESSTAGHSHQSAHPNTFILGAAKSGTTTLYEVLRRHPEVYMSEPKEPRFFELEFEQGIDHYCQKYFRGWTGQPIIGEARSRHLYVPFIPERIFQCFPGAQLIAVLRDPIDRAHSDWWMHYGQRKERLAFPDAIERNLSELEAGQRFTGPNGPDEWANHLERTDHGRRILHRTYIDEGYYAVQLQRYLKLFPTNSFLILFFEDLIRRPHETLRQVGQFLGLQDTLTVDDLPRFNAALSPFLNRVIRFGQVTRLVRLLPSRAKPIIHHHLSRYGKRPPIEPSVLRKLEEHYESHNEALTTLLGRPVSWAMPEEAK